MSGPPARKTTSRQIAKYIADTGDLKNALAVVDKITSEVIRLADFPLSGVFPKDKILRNDGYRMLIVEKYLIFYLLAAEKVSIVAIIHGAQKYSHLTIE